MDPIRLSRRILTAAKVDLGQYAYAGQYEQNPIPAGGGMFQTDKINVVNVAPNKVRKTVRYWDKAGTAGKGDYTVGFKMGLMAEGGFLIMDIVRGRWGTAERERRIQQTAKMDGDKTRIIIEQEPGSGGKESAENTIRHLAGFRARADRPTGDKVFRADPFSVQVNVGNVYMLMGNWNRDFMDEAEFFPFSTYDDQMDAGSGAFNHLVSRRVVGVWGNEKG